MKEFKTVFLLMFCSVFCFFTGAVAQQVDIFNPFTVDENTVLLMHFDGDLTNVSTLSEDGDPQGRINFIPSLPNLGQAVWIDNDKPSIDTSMIIVAHSEALNLKTSYTIEGWSNNITFDGGYGTARSYHPWLIRKGTTGGGNDAHYGIQVNPFLHNFEATSVYTNFIEQIWTRLVTNDGTVDLGEWYHFTLIKDFDNKAFILLIHDINGNLYQWAASLLPSTSNTGASDTTAYNDEPLFFALNNLGHQDEGIFHWNGFMDEVRISNVVRNYSVPPVIGNVGIVFEGHNPKANQPVQVAAEIRLVGNNTLSGAPVLHYDTGDGVWQEKDMIPSGTENIFVVDVPGQPKGASVTYYVTAKNQDGVEGRYPSKYGNFSAIGYWDEFENTLDITFEEGPPGPPQDYSIYKHQILMIGDNLSYSTDVPPALAGESNYSMAVNMDIDAEYPDTCGFYIPEPTPFINGEYDVDGNYGWTIDFWLKVDSTFNFSGGVDGGVMPVHTGTLAAQTPGNLMHRFDVLDDDSFNMRFYQSWAQLNVPLPGIKNSGKWFHAIAGETRDLYFARFFDENDSLVAYGTVSKSSFEPFDPPFSTVALIFGQSWKDNDFRGWMDDIKFFNYPKGLPPTFYSIDAANVLQNQPFTVMGAVAHPGTEISTVQVHYMFSSAPEQWQTMNMNLLSGATYTAEIPAQPIGTIMQYYLSAEATNGLRSTTPPYAETKGDYLSNAWWKAESQTLDLTFEEGPTGPLMDHSEYQQTLISYGNPQFSDDAKDGNYALALDGDSTYLEIVPAPFFNSGEYTVDFWFKPDASIATGVVFMVQEAEEWNKGPFFIQSRGDKFRDDVYIEGNEGIYRVRFNYGAKFKAGNWYRHILSVGRDSAYTEMRDKDDQILERQSTPINGHAVMVSGPFRLGAGQPDQAFTGKMDNVHIYNYSIGGTSTKVAQDAGAVPTYFALMQNYPNPFNPTTNIRYSVPTSEEVTLIVYDVLGRQVRKLVDKALSAGEYSITWDGKNDENVDVATGVYFYQLEARNKNVTKLQVRKMVLVH